MLVNSLGDTNLGVRIKAKIQNDRNSDVSKQELCAETNKLNRNKQKVLYLV